MARLESQSKLLYYPTPNAIAETIASWFSAPRKTRLADPCCGTGEALMRFSQGFKEAERIGIELSYSRSEQAAQVLDKVLPTSFYTATWSVQSVGLMFNNPPYDWSQYGETVNGQSRSVRHEVMFVERARDKIVVGGHHAIIIPRCILGDAHYLGNSQQERVARHLLGWYEDVLVYRFPDGEYEAFKQVVVLACKRRAKYQAPTKDAINAIVALADEEMDIPVLPEGQGQYEIPAVSGTYTFKFTPREPADAIRAVRRANPVKTPEWERATYVQPIGESFNPVEAIKVGHITLLVSSGNVGVVGIPDEGLLVKGTSRKTASTSIVTNIDDKGNKSDNVTETEKFEPVWTLARQDGSIEVVSDISRIASLATRYARPLADAVQVKNAPRYANNPTPQEWRRTGRIGISMPDLPGRSERGLFERQRHWAVALQRAMRKQRHAIANLGMGTGKTLISVAALNVLDEFPAIVTCPAHMPAEWVKTFVKGSDPDDPIRVMWITRPVSDIAPAPIPAQIEHNGEVLDFSKPASPIFHPKYQPGWITEWNASTGSKWASFCQAVQNAGGHITGDIRWHDEQNDVVRRWRRATIDCEPAQAAQIAALVSRTLVVRLDGMTYKPECKFRSGGLDVTFFDPDEYTLFEFQKDYQTGKLGRKAVAVVSIESAKYDAGDDQRLHIFKTHAVVEDVETGERRRVTRHICPKCGQPVQAGWRTCQQRDKRRKLADPITVETGKVVSYHLAPLPDNEKDLPVCGAPLFQFTRNRRVGAARLAQKKQRGLFKVYIADELHKSKSLDTDSGVADQRLIAGTKYSLGLTGTLFGGNASSIFPILYRRVPEVRARFGFNDLTRWVDTYGLWEKKWSEDNASVTGRGASTGIKRWGYRSRELPGVSPAVIRYLLPIAVFGQVTDLGYELPPFSDEVELVSMTDEMVSQYRNADARILYEAMKLLRSDGDPGGLSVWFSFCRFRPNSMFRPEVVSYDGKWGGGFAFDLPAVDGWLPKERRLAEIIAENARRRRKTLVFAEQTGTRDIRHRMQRAIEEVGNPLVGRPLRVEVLSAGDMAPARRMAWIKANAPGMDALIVNPKLVETGLTLTMFSDIAFYEVTPSLYTLWQSMRRVWRLGQDKDVTTKFLAYAGTVEADILQRMGKKMKYASMLYGDSAASVLESNDEDGSIQEEIIRAALAGKLEDERQAVPQVARLFSTGDEKSVKVSTAITSSVVAATPALPVSLMEWTVARGVAVSTRRKAKAVPDGQLAFGF
jgi:hypothetical protein